MNPATTTSATPNKSLLVNQEEVESKKEATTNHIPRPKPATFEGKHIAKRPISHWLNYGDPKDWDEAFEISVLSALNEMKNGNLDHKNIIQYFERTRHEIATQRGNLHAFRFGLRRDIEDKVPFYTECKHDHLSYGYALERAIQIPYDEKNYIESCCEAGTAFIRKAKMEEPLRYGLVQGCIGDKVIPLTQYIFSKRNLIAYNMNIFGFSPNSYTGQNNESGVWVHTSSKYIPVVIKHIEELIQKAIKGDLTVIPKIHYWYVHLAPTWRGSGGTAEMLTNTLCRFNNVELPAWKEGVAPSIEILLEPNEDKFCSTYHQLFETDQEKLAAVFKTTKGESGAVSDKSGNAQESSKRPCSDNCDTELTLAKVAKSEASTFSENRADESGVCEQSYLLTLCNNLL